MSCNYIISYMFGKGLEEGLGYNLINPLRGKVDCISFR